MTVNGHYDLEHQANLVSQSIPSHVVLDALMPVGDVQNALNSIFVSQVGFHGCKMPLPHSKHFGT